LITIAIMGTACTAVTTITRIVTTATV